MSRSRLDPPLVPRNGNTLKVLGIARISGRPGQTELSLTDQEALYRSWLNEQSDVTFTLIMVAGRGSGECLDRAEAEKAQAELESGQYDLVIAEDLGRIFRRVHAYLFCETAEDVGTRVIALNDHVDTAQDGWRLNAFFASIPTDLSIKDASHAIDELKALPPSNNNGGHR